MCQIRQLYWAAYCGGLIHHNTTITVTNNPLGCYLCRCLHPYNKMTELINASIRLQFILRVHVPNSICSFSAVTKMLSLKLRTITIDYFNNLLDCVLLYHKFEQLKHVTSSILGSVVPLFSTCI